jgi:hypothetical protein
VASTMTTPGWRRRPANQAEVTSGFIETAYKQHA